MEIKKVGVVGCGHMGAGIAQVSAQSGYQVTVSETSKELLAKGLSTIDHYLTRYVEHNRITQKDKELTLARIRGTTDTGDFADCDLVIEVIPEEINLKRKFFTELDKICQEKTIFASNTSVLSIADMAAVTKRPEKFIGLHFLSPVPIAKLMEIVRPEKASDETIEAARKFIESLGKVYLITKDTPAFVFNRLYMAYLHTAVRMLEQGLGSRDDIDKAMTMGLGHPMGPLAMLDYDGIDVHYMMALAVYEKTKDPLYAPPDLMKTMFEKGWLGRKTGKGFYDYKK